MQTGKALLIVGLAAILTSTALGVAPMGPPMALMGEGRWGLGFEYGRVNADLEAVGIFGSVYFPDTPAYDFIETVQIDDLTMNMLFGTLSYGVCDNWDIFLRIGAADAKDDMRARSNSPREALPPEIQLPDQLGAIQEYRLDSLDSSFGLAWGVGSRATFCRSGPWSFGGLVQATWFKPDDSDIAYTDPLFVEDPATQEDLVHVGTAELDFWTAQVSLAVAFQADTLSLWAGPFLQFVEGDLDRDGIITPLPGATFDASSDLEEDSQIGAHLGLNWEMTQQLDLWVEGQITGDSWLIGVGLIIGPEETFGM